MECVQRVVRCSLWQHLWMEKNMTNTCKPCKQAAVANERAVELEHYNQPKKAAEAFMVAQAFHDECRSCDCAHEVGAY